MFKLSSDQKRQFRDRLFATLWKQYKKQVSHVDFIEKELKNKGEQWIEDHIAFRCLPVYFLNLQTLKKLFTFIGYEEQAKYYFEQKQLRAISLQPETHSGRQGEVSPKIFISELIEDKFSQEFKDAINQIRRSETKNVLTEFESIINSDKTNEDKIEHLEKFYAHILTTFPSWGKPDFKIYEILKKESEYASWTYVYGAQLNHFTVCTHLLNHFKNLTEFSRFIEQEMKIPMNHTSGLIKGSPEFLLEQSSTMAQERMVKFKDQEREVKYAFIEFIYRFPLAGKKADGMWDSYNQGFKVDNADKIFESTYDKKDKTHLSAG